MRTEIYLKELIKEKYGSINSFAKVVNIPQSTLATALSKKNGFNNMSVGSAIKICHTLGIDIETLDNIIEQEDIKENRLIDIYRSISDSGKNLLLDIGESVRDYELEEKAQEQPKPKNKFLIAASGAKNATDEEIEEAIELAKNL